MADQVVIVTGSRALADSPEATRWAREILVRELSEAATVIAGDARGPDEWAHEIALAGRAGWQVRWQLDGRVMARLLFEWQEESRWHNDPMPRRGDREGWRQICLARNVAMIASCEGRAGTRIVGLIDAASKTRGTQHTLSIARSGGFNVTQFVWGAS